MPCRTSRTLAQRWRLWFMGSTVLVYVQSSWSFWHNYTTLTEMA